MKVKMLEQERQQVEFASRMSRLAKQTESQMMSRNGS
jgi:hypothetical protein